jgi:hypothetical protein
MIEKSLNLIVDIKGEIQLKIEMKDNFFINKYINK